MVSGKINISEPSFNGKKVVIKTHGATNKEEKRKA